MNEQTIILFFLIVSLGVTLSLYIFKAKKQMNYMGDERWEMIQLKSYRIASISTWSYVKKKYKLNTTNFLFLCNC